MVAAWGERGPCKAEEGLAAVPVAAWTAAGARAGLGVTVGGVLVAAARRAREAVGLAWAETALEVEGLVWVGSVWVAEAMEKVEGVRE